MPGRICLSVAVAAATCFAASVVNAQVVPGTGTRVNFDDFEQENWGWRANWPKSSKEQDEQIRHPIGRSLNGKWFESPKRGQPDVVKRVETPMGGLEGSTGALYLRSRDTGIPGRPGYEMGQDDFIMSPKPMALHRTPSTVVRVFLPPWEEWEQKTGVSFGMRLGMQGPQEKTEEVTVRRLFRKITRMETRTKMEPYYPGFFIQFNSKNDRQYNQDHAVLIVRAGNSGHDITGPRIMQTGWWTFGMSVTPDARVHYYASPGVDDLTAADHIVSTKPYDINGTYFNTIFFNVCSQDTGSSWSTPWIVDDPAVYMGGGSRMATRR